MKVISNDLARRIKRDKYLLLLLLPVILHYLIFNYGPMYGLLLAFKDFKMSQGILGSPWIGFKYFQDFFDSIYFWRLIRNTLVINVYTLVFGFPIPIIFAVALNELKYGFFKKFVQTTSYFPYFISTVIVVALLFNFFNSNDGLITKILQTLGYENQNILGDSALFRLLYVSTGISLYF